MTNSGIPPLWVCATAVPIAKHGKTTARETSFANDIDVLYVAPHGTALGRA
jgi:hypothetical protein